MSLLFGRIFVPFVERMWRFANNAGTDRFRCISGSGRGENRLEGGDIFG